LAGLLFDVDGERLTPSHALKKGRRYRYYVSAALISEAGTECARGWRLAATEIETAVIQILTDALTNPAALIEPLGITGMPVEQVRKILGRAARHAASLERSSAEQAKILEMLIDKVIIAENMMTIRLRRGALIAGEVLLSTSDSANDTTIELTAAAAFKRRGLETRLVLPSLVQQNRRSRCDPALVKAIARGRVWFEELASGRARSLQDLAKRDGITRRYIRRLINRAFLSPELVEAILQGRQPVALTATRLSELDLPLEWTEQRRLLTS